MNLEKSYYVARLLRRSSLMEEWSKEENSLSTLTNQVDHFLSEAAHAPPVVMEDKHILKVTGTVHPGQSDVVELNLVAGVFEERHSDKLTQDILVSTERSAQQCNEEKKREAEALLHLWSSLTPGETGEHLCSSICADNHHSSSTGDNSLLERNEMSFDAKTFPEGKDSGTNDGCKKVEKKLSHRSLNSRRKNESRIGEECLTDTAYSNLEDSNEVDIMLADSCSSSSSDQSCCSPLPKKICVLK